ncbi:hypothetical protein VNO77_28426 [Canavalia gladiata]|uniref:Transmembrane protein n=1 Tax=Canavalia gladiata TaxID=3824 RepID=A0AAN9KVI0_CANGL
MGRDLFLIDDDHVVETHLRFGLKALHLFGVILISLSVISLVILSCGEYDDSIRPRRRDGGGDGGGDDGGGCACGGGE